MGMETALAHVLPTRNTFGLELTRLDMKLLADMLTKGAYNKKELKTLRGWVDKHVGKRLQLRTNADSKRFDMSLAMYLIVRDVMAASSCAGLSLKPVSAAVVTPTGTPPASSTISG